MSTAAATVSRPVRRVAFLRRSPFFTLLGLMMLALAIGGFWPQYFSAVIGRTPEPTTRYWLIHLHAALFLSWLILYIGQATLVLSGRTRVHMKVGPWLATYGFVIALVGLYAALRLAARFGERLQNFEQAPPSSSSRSSTWSFSQDFSEQPCCFANVRTCTCARCCWRPIRSPWWAGADWSSARIR